MTNNNITGRKLTNYLSAYRDAVKTNLNEMGLPIVNELNSILENKS